jgi:hypothetical protein
MTSTLGLERELLLGLDPSYTKALGVRAYSLELDELRNNVRDALIRGGKDAPQARILTELCSAASRKPRGVASALRIYGYDELAATISPPARAAAAPTAPRGPVSEAYARGDYATADRLAHELYGVGLPASPEDAQAKAKAEAERERLCDDLDRRMGLGAYAPDAPPKQPGGNVFVLGPPKRGR